MSEEFKIGDIAIGCNFLFDAEYNGMECRIVGGYEHVEATHPVLGTRLIWAYWVKFADGSACNVLSINLRRRKPPTTGEETCMSWFVVTPQREKAPA